MERMDLVVLMYASNNCYTTVKALDDTKVRVDLEKENWFHKKRSYDIGRGRYVRNPCGEGIIGFIIG